MNSETKNYSNAIGTLGISGKYRKLSEVEKQDCLKYILQNFNLIDTSSVYGVDGDINLKISDIVKSIKKTPKIINKIGADVVNHSAVDLMIKEYENQQYIFRDYPVHTLLLHRPSIEKLKRDATFYKVIEKEKTFIRFGISTNNIDVVKAYSDYMGVNTVQIACNLLDYEVNLPILEFSKKMNFEVHARSVLSSGLLSGKYNKKNALFTDELRSRFLENEKTKNILYSRLRMVKSIEKEYGEYLNKKKVNLASFIYSLTENSPLIDVVIRGGSNMEQIIENGMSQKINEKMLIDETFNKLYSKWTAPYL